MRVGMWGLAIGLMLVVGAERALGSEPIAVEVLQPIDTEDTIWLSRMTYVGYHGTPIFSAFAAVPMTCDSNIVVTHLGPLNRNVAFEAGLKVRVLLNSGVEPPLFGDTMRVVLDARALEAWRPEAEWADTLVLEATVQCVIVNAAQLPATKFVDLKIEGKPRYQKFGRVYRTYRYRCGPVRREFD